MKKKFADNSSCAGTRPFCRKPPKKEEKLVLRETSMEEATAAEQNLRRKRICSMRTRNVILSQRQRHHATRAQGEKNNLSAEEEARLQFGI
ncbi:unnamed protein product [Sphagnum jensenii]|uniref:Uncharacterized protein n=1 Tax=Sphagnum jensenii TaxID=128206 RepID=A0ABP1AG38_9BRYO